MKELNIHIDIRIFPYEELNAADRELIDAAREATFRSYSPYSHFSVGAAARLADGTIAGSATNLFDCMKIAHQKMGLPLEIVVRCASYNPARSIGQLARFGSIEPGKEANLLLIDDELNLKGIMLRGRFLKKAF